MRLLSLANLKTKKSATIRRELQGIRIYTLSLRNGTKAELENRKSAKRIFYNGEVQKLNSLALGNIHFKRYRIEVG